MGRQRGDRNRKLVKNKRNGGVLLLQNGEATQHFHHILHVHAQQHNDFITESAYLGREVLIEEFQKRCRRDSHMGKTQKDFTYQLQIMLNGRRDEGRYRTRVVKTPR